MVARTAEEGGIHLDRVDHSDRVVLADQEVQEDPVAPADLLAGSRQTKSSGRSFYRTFYGI